MDLAIKRKKVFVCYYLNEPETMMPVTKDSILYNSVHMEIQNRKSVDGRLVIT